MNFLFAWRYFKARKSTNAINIIAWVSMVAIIVITASFIILLSVFNGFEGLVKSLYSSFYSDLRITAVEGKRITVSYPQLSKLRIMPEINKFSLEMEEKALLQNGDVQAIVYLKGVDEHYTGVSQVSQRMIRGSFELGTADKPAIVLGSGIENALALYADKTLYPITAYLFRPGVDINVVDPYQAFSAENLQPSGTFFIQQDIDNKYAITNLGFMKRMLNMKEDEYGSIELSVVEGYDPESVKELLQSVFADGYVVETRYEQNKSLYSVMTLEKWAIYGILTLMLVVAAFTMIGALTMLVLEKQKDIQVLKALGATNKVIQNIFLSEGILLGGLGTAGGIVLATLVCWAQIKYKLVAIQGGTFLIDYYPVKMVFSDFILVITTVMTIAILASWVPSRRAAAQTIELKS